MKVLPAFLLALGLGALGGLLAFLWASYGGEVYLAYLAGAVMRCF